MVYYSGGIFSSYICFWSNLYPERNLQVVPIEEVCPPAAACGPPDAGALVAHGGEGGADTLALAAAASVVAHVDGVRAQLILAAGAGAAAAEEVPETGRSSQ